MPADRYTVGPRSRRRSSPVCAGWLETEQTSKHKREKSVFADGEMYVSTREWGKLMKRIGKFNQTPMMEATGKMGLPLVSGTR